MVRVWTVAVIAVPVLFGVLAGCNSRAQQPTAAVDDEQRELVMSGVGRLQQALNDGACGSIYDEADERFRRHQSRKDWQVQCEYIRWKWGSWVSFEASQWYRSGPHLVEVEGTAAFAGGACVVQVAWVVDNARAQMTWLSVRGEGEHISAPPPQIPGPMDPPRKQNRTPA